MSKVLDFAKMGTTRPEFKNENKVRGNRSEAFIYFFGGEASRKLPKN
jgi:hypothetical protein